VSGSAASQSWGHVSSDDAGRVNSRRQSRFLLAEFRWTDTNRQKPNDDPDFASGLNRLTVQGSCIIERIGI